MRFVYLISVLFLLGAGCARREAPAPGQSQPAPRATSSSVKVLTAAEQECNQIGFSGSRSLPKYLPTDVPKPGESFKLGRVECSLSYTNDGSVLGPEYTLWWFGLQGTKTFQMIKDGQAALTQSLGWKVSVNPIGGIIEAEKDGKKKQLSFLILTGFPEPAKTYKAEAFPEADIFIKMHVSVFK